MSTIELRLDDLDIVCQYGKIDTPSTAFHGFVGNGSGVRQCFHALKPLPPVVLFGADAILDIGPMPYMHTATWPCILSRHGDLVTMAFDRVGPIGACHRRPRTPFRPMVIQEYRLSPVQWWDEYTPTHTMLLGVWVNQQEMS